MTSIRHIELGLPEGFAMAPTFTQLIDYSDGHWGMRFGEYGCSVDVVASTESMYEFYQMLGDMLKDNEEEQAALSGDFENESKLDVLNTEAWLEG